MHHSTFPRSEVLILGPNSVQSLVPSTLISQIEALLDSHRIEDAVDLADRQRKKLQGNIAIDEDEADELRYVYQRIGFQCFSETLFDDAGKNLFNGEIDPRLLISYYPDLRGSLFNAEESVDAFAGVAERMPTEASVEDIIRNYSPHLSPNTRTASPTVELRKIMVMAATEMLEVFLRKCRARQKVNGGEVHPSHAVVDTVLAKLYIQFEKTQELFNLVGGPNDIILSEVEPTLRESGRFNALCMLYKQRGDDSKLLEVWSKMIDGEWWDEDIKDPVSDMISLLTERRDKALTQKWGIWLTKRHPERGLKLLMPRDNGKRRERPEEDVALLKQIQDANPTAGIQFLEYLVLQRRSTSRDLHSQLALTCVQQVLTALTEDHVSKLWRAKASSYASSRNESSFLSYFASTTPDSEHKRVRLKTILFLAGSSLYDPESIRQRLLERENILRFELALLEGKLGNHRAALSTLVHHLHDASSAEIYCTLGGSIVPTRTAQSIAESIGLQSWASTLFGLPSGNAKSAPTSTRPVDEKLKGELLKILLEVYMSDEAAEDRAAHLLNSQAMNLDVLDVISLVPDKWPLKAMSSFLAHSLRSTLHARHEGQIVKAISAGQNLEVKDRTWLTIRDEGMVIEEAGDGDGAEADGEVYDEKRGLAEKVVLQLGSEGEGGDEKSGRLAGLDLDVPRIT